jgi:predicted molibdopterin-dependent oxidoreductase YjgC
LSSSSPEDERRGQFVRIASFRTEPVQIWIDGEATPAWEGQSVLTALLAVRDRVRELEFSGEPRAGFCLMGACQDCWIWLSEEQRGRACTTPVVAGMRIFTTAPGAR